MDTGRTRMRMVATLTLALAMASFGATGCARAEESSEGARRPSADVERIVEDHCRGCHSASKALRWRTKDAAQAKKIVDAMVDRGADLTRAERATLITYYLR